MGPDKRAAAIVLLSDSANCIDGASYIRDEEVKLSEHLYWNLSDFYDKPLLFS